MRKDGDHVDFGFNEIINKFINITLEYLFVFVSYP